MGNEIFYEVMDKRSGFLYAEFDTLDEALAFVGTNSEGIEHVTVLRCSLGAQTCKRVEIPPVG